MIDSESATKALLHPRLCSFNTKILQNRSQLLRLSAKKNQGPFQHFSTYPFNPFHIFQHISTTSKRLLEKNHGLPWLRPRRAHSLHCTQPFREPAARGGGGGGTGGVGDDLCRVGGKVGYLDLSDVASVFSWKSW